MVIKALVRKKSQNTWQNFTSSHEAQVCNETEQNSIPNFLMLAQSGLYQTHTHYHKNKIKNLTPDKFAVITLKFEQGSVYQKVTSPKAEYGQANSVDPDQSDLGPRGAVRSGSTLFAQTGLSENLGTSQCINFLSFFFVKQNTSPPPKKKRM